MGRKKKEDWERKDTIVWARLNELATMELDKMCERERCSRSDMIRKALMREFIRQRD